MSKQLHSAKIKIGKKHYPLKVTDEELKNLAEIEKHINARIIDILGKYSDLQLEDALAMILIESRFEMSRSNKSENQLDPILKDIETSIKSVL